MSSSYKLTFRNQVQDLMQTPMFEEHYKKLNFQNHATVQYLNLVEHIFNRQLNAENIDDFISRQNIKAYLDDTHMSMAVRILEDTKQVLTENTICASHEVLSREDYTKYCLTLLDNITKYVFYKPDIKPNEYWNSFYKFGARDIFQYVPDVVKCSFISGKDANSKSSQFDEYEECLKLTGNIIDLYDKSPQIYNVLTDTKILSSALYSFPKDKKANVALSWCSYSFIKNSYDYYNKFCAEITHLSKKIQLCTWSKKNNRFEKVPFKIYRKYFLESLNIKYFLDTYTTKGSLSKNLEEWYHRQKKYFDNNGKCEGSLRSIEFLYDDKNKVPVKYNDLARLHLNFKSNEESSPLIKALALSLSDFYKESSAENSREPTIVISRNNQDGVSKIYTTQCATTSSISTTSNVKSLSNSCMRYDNDYFSLANEHYCNVDVHPSRVFGTEDFMIFAGVNLNENLDNEKSFNNYDAALGEKFNSLASRCVVRMIDNECFIRKFAKEHLNPDMSIDKVNEILMKHFNFSLTNAKNFTTEPTLNREVSTFKDIIFGEEKYMVCLPKYVVSQKAYEHINNAIKSYAEEHGYKVITDITTPLYELSKMNFNPVFKRKESVDKDDMLTSDVKTPPVKFNVLETSSPTMVFRGSIGSTIQQNEMFSFPYIDFIYNHVNVISTNDDKFCLISNFPENICVQGEKSFSKTTRFESLNVDNKFEIVESEFDIFSKSKVLSGRQTYKGVFSTDKRIKVEAPDCYDPKEVTAEDFNPDNFYNANVHLKLLFNRDWVLNNSLSSKGFKRYTYMKPSLRITSDPKKFLNNNVVINPKFIKTLLFSTETNVIANSIFNDNHTSLVSRLNKSMIISSSVLLKPSEVQEAIDKGYLFKIDDGKIVQNYYPLTSINYEYDLSLKDDFLDKSKGFINFKDMLSEKNKILTNDNIEHIKDYLKLYDILLLKSFCKDNERYTYRKLSKTMCKFLGDYKYFRINTKNICDFSSIDITYFFLKNGWFMCPLTKDILPLTQAEPLFYESGQPIIYKTCPVFVDKSFVNKVKENSDNIFKLEVPSNHFYNMISANYRYNSLTLCKKSGSLILFNAAEKIKISPINSYEIPNIINFINPILKNTEKEMSYDLLSKIIKCFEKRGIDKNLLSSEKEPIRKYFSIFKKDVNDADSYMQAGEFETDF